MRILNLATETSSHIHTPVAFTPRSMPAHTAWDPVVQASGDKKNHNSLLGITPRLSLTDVTLPSNAALPVSPIKPHSPHRLLILLYSLYNPHVSVNDTTQVERVFKQKREERCLYFATLQGIRAWYSQLSNPILSLLHSDERFSRRLTR
jgi:hypothetical protein